MAERYVIGLTGNIATGKSIVRRMLQELGASTIDADGLVHVLQRPGTPVYREIVDMFGSFILNADATINRPRLGAIAFSVPEAMRALERITHPAVRNQIKYAIKKAPTPIVAVEAIKLLEGELVNYCDAVWVVTAPQDVQVLRLMTRRKMSRAVAMKRVRAQSPPEEKIARAEVVIDNGGDVIHTWNAVQRAYNKIPLVVKRKKTAKPVAPADVKKVVIRRAKRNDLPAMMYLLRTGSAGALNLDEAQMMERFFSKGYFLATRGKKLLGVIGWQAENLVAGVDDFFVTSKKDWHEIGGMLLDAVESAGKELSCEVGLLFLRLEVEPVAKTLVLAKGYRPKQPDGLIKVWREAAEDWRQEGTLLLVKQFLKRRINAPL